MTSFADARRAAGVATPDIKAIVLLPLGPARRPRVAPVLSPADEAELVRRYLDGDRWAGQRLLEAHHGFIYSMAVRRARLCSLLDEQDLLQAGRIGFLAALKNYDSSKGTLRQFASTTVSHAMTDAMDEEDGTIVIPKHQQAAVRRALKAGGLSGKLEAIDRLRRTVSLDAENSDDDDRSLLDRLSGYGRTPEDVVIAAEEIAASGWSPDDDDEPPPAEDEIFSYTLDADDDSPAPDRGSSRADVEHRLLLRYRAGDTAAGDALMRLRDASVGTAAARDAVV